MCAQWRLRSACAYAQSDQSSPGALCVAKDSGFLQADSEDWADCANAQADLSLLWRTCPQVYYFAYDSTVIPIMLFMLNLSCNILKHFPLDNWQTSMERVTKRKMWPILAYIVIHCVAAELTYSGNGESKYKVYCFICNLYVIKPLFAHSIFIPLSLA